MTASEGPVACPWRPLYYEAWSGVTWAFNLEVTCRYLAALVRLFPEDGRTGWRDESKRDGRSSAASKDVSASQHGLVGSNAGAGVRTRNGPAPVALVLSSVLGLDAANDTEGMASWLWTPLLPLLSRRLAEPITKLPYVSGAGALRQEAHPESDCDGPWH